MLVELLRVIYNPKARDGTWCKLPYPNHPHGCPNFPKCPAKFQDFKTLVGYRWYAVTITFDLKGQATLMKMRHPEWTDRQARNCLYWQGHVRKMLRSETYGRAKHMAPEEKYDDPEIKDPVVVLEIPEACGVDVVQTMGFSGHHIETNMDLTDLIMKVTMIGVKSKYPTPINEVSA